MKRRLWPFFLVTLGSIACGTWSNVKGTDDDFTWYTEMCGFPTSQLVEYGPDGQHFGRLQVGQRIPLEIVGDTGRIKNVSWRSANEYAPHPPVVRVTPTGRLTAVLEAMAEGGDGPHDYVQVFAEISFPDGSRRGAEISACERGGYTPVDRVVVVR